LRTAGATFAAGWFMLRGYEVLWPLEPCRYDFVARDGTDFQRIQVKTTTYRSGRSYVANLSNSRRAGRVVYDVDELDYFFAIDADLNAYLIPFADVSGYGQIVLRGYCAYLDAERGQWLRNPTG
jgi:hypothetical protein